MTGESELRVLSEAAQLSDLAARLRRYFATVRTAYLFFSYGSVATSYWLTALALSLLTGAEGDPAFWVAAVLVAIPVLVISGVLGAAAGPRVSSRTWGRKGRLSGPIYAFAFFATFLTTASLRLYYLAPIAWYPALAVAHLLIYSFVEREAYRKGEVSSRPFLVSGASMLAAAPLVLHVTLSHFQAGWLLALSLTLACFSAAAFAALRSAARALEAEGGRGNGGAMRSGGMRGSPKGG